MDTDGRVKDVDIDQRLIWIPRFLSFMMHYDNIMLHNIYLFYDFGFQITVNITSPRLHAYVVYLLTNRFNEILLRVLWLSLLIHYHHSREWLQYIHEKNYI